MIPLTTKQVLKKLGGDRVPGKVIVSAELTPWDDYKNVYTTKDVTYDILETGKEYEVRTDSGTYKSVCKELEMGTARGKWLGNLSVSNLIETEDTGENFCVYVFETSYVQFSIEVTDNSTKATVTEAETIHPIDPKFLPGVCLPVVELSTIIDSVGNTEFTAEEKDAFHKAETESPVFIICFNYGGTEFAGVTARAGQGGIYGHTVQTPIGWFSFFYVDGMLSVTIEQNT